MDIIRNVGIREQVQQGASKITDTDFNTLAMKITDTKLLRSSLPNLAVQSQRNESMVDNIGVRNSVDNKDDNNGVDDDDEGEEGCAISGRLEIRVVPQTNEQKISPNREESVYFDAVAGTGGSSGTGGGIGCGNGDDTKVSRRLANKLYATEQSAPADSNENADEMVFYSTVTVRKDNQSSAQQAVHVKHSDSNAISGEADNRYASINDQIEKNVNVLDDNDGVIRQLCNANDSASAVNNKDFPAASLSLYPNQTATTAAVNPTIQQLLTTCALAGTTTTTPIMAHTMTTATINTIKPITDQLDALPTSPNVSHSNSNSNLNAMPENERKDATNNSISTTNNSSHNNSKIPVLNPNVRSAKCASWAGNDLPLTTNLNELTPGNLHT